MRLVPQIGAANTENEANLLVPQIEQSVHHLTPALRNEVITPSVSTTIFASVTTG